MAVWMADDFIERLREHYRDDDQKIIEVWNKIIKLDIVAVMNEQRANEQIQFKKFMSDKEPCVSCGREYRREDMYAHGVLRMERVQWVIVAGGYRRNCSSACYDCQKQYIQNCTAKCRDCGTDFLRSSTKKIRCDACQTKRTPDLSKVANANKRTSKLGLISDLTYEEWVITLDYFGRKCAYCGGDYEALDHYIPVARGGGTTFGNCVPSCNTCNYRKFDKFPSEVFSNNVLAPIIEYLSSREAVF